MKKSAGCGIIMKKKRECGIRTPLPDPVFKQHIERPNLDRYLLNEDVYIGRWSLSDTREDGKGLIQGH